MRRTGLLLLVGLAVAAAAHAGEFMVENLRIVRSPQGVFLKGQIVYPAKDDLLKLEVVTTDRGEGVLKVREEGG